MTIFLDSSLGIPNKVLWFNVCNKELLALRNNFRVTKKFLIAKFEKDTQEEICRYSDVFCHFQKIEVKKKRTIVRKASMELVGPVGTCKDL